MATAWQGSEYSNSRCGYSPPGAGGFAVAGFAVRPGVASGLGVVGDEVMAGVEKPPPVGAGGGGGYSFSAKSTMPVVKCKIGRSFPNENSSAPLIGAI